jgi:hypothetical protein
MSIKIGGIDLADAVINSEYRIGVLEKIVERLAQYAPPGCISQGFIDEARDKTLKEMQKKYPDAGLKKNG